MRGISISLPISANAKLAIGTMIKLLNIPNPHIQPIAGRHPATNRDLCAASCLFTST